MRSIRQELAVGPETGDSAAAILEDVLGHLMDGLRAQEFGAKQVALPDVALTNSLLKLAEALLRERKRHELEVRKAQALQDANYLDLVNQGNMDLAVSSVVTRRGSTSTATAKAATGAVRELQTLEDKFDSTDAFFAAGNLSITAILAAFVHSAVWTLAGVLAASGATLAEMALRARMTEHLAPMRTPETDALEQDGHWVLPPHGSVLEHVYDTGKGQWIRSDKLVPPFHMVLGASFKDLTVVTPEGFAMRDIMGRLLANDSHVMLLGGTGSGKTALIRMFLNDPPSNLTHEATPAKPGDEPISDDSVNSLHVIEASLSMQMTPDKLQTMIEGHLVKVRRRTWGPPAGLNSVFFVDDLAAAGPGEALARRERPMMLVSRRVS